MSRISLLPVVTVLGLMAGMVGMGTAARWTGRRTGSIVTASCMCAGGFGMFGVALWNSDDQNNQQHAMRALAFSLFVLGVGVGGEYPLAAASASERAMEDMAHQQQPWQQQQQPAGDPHIGQSSSSLSIDEVLKIHNHKDPSFQQHQHTQPQSRRGRQVQLVFTMQGAGIFLNSLILTVLLWATNQRTDEYDVATLRTVWQITCVVPYFWIDSGMLVVVGVLIMARALSHTNTRNLPQLSVPSSSR